jgi:hypothetical protein
MHIKDLSEGLKRKHHFADMRRWEDNIKKVRNDVGYECVDLIRINNKGISGGLLQIRYFCGGGNVERPELLLTFIVAPCILKSIYFTHQQKHYLLNTHKYRSYMFRSSTIIRELVLSLAKVTLKHYTDIILPSILT